MRTISVDVTSIQVGERQRALSSDAVARLAGSMRDIGLQQPITIRIADLMVLDGQEVEGVPVLVAGSHRLAAAKALGWSHIDCIEIDDDALTAELWEIAENLHRHDLTKEQRDQHIRRYAELIEARRDAERQAGLKVHPVLADGRRSGPQHEKSVASEIAAQTGISRKTVVRAIKRQSQAAPPIDELSESEVIARQVDAVMRQWNKAGPEARAIIREQIDTPIMDARHAA